MGHGLFSNHWLLLLYFLGLKTHSILARTHRLIESHFPLQQNSRKSGCFIKEEDFPVFSLAPFTELCCLQLRKTGPSQCVISKGRAASFSCQSVAELFRAAGWAMGDRLGNRRAWAAHREGLLFPLLSGCKCYLCVLIRTGSPQQGAIFLT